MHSKPRTEQQCSATRSVHFSPRQSVLSTYCTGKDAPNTMVHWLALMLHNQKVSDFSAWTPVVLRFITVSLSPSRQIVGQYQVLWFSPVSIISPLLYIHSCIIWGMDNGPISGQVPHRHSLIQSQKNKAMTTSSHPSKFTIQNIILYNLCNWESTVNKGG
jgi:hypothetical protein